MAQIIKIRRDTAAEWSSVNPVLAHGEMGIEMDTLKAKVGDGIATWVSLPYFIGAEVSDKTYLYTQAVPSATWTINHNLGKYPSVTVIDSAGSEVEGDVNHESINITTISFTNAFSGSASLN